ncbi:epimerase [Aeromicrobium sp. Root495]|uniref:NAD-dependent epimerase/dehydratase family protein n=1 Tax=Aeromicrobium sp. Root495 TaxID=1736550 RepID=UPI0006FCBCDF|nr:NAD-dependent epimerase/dehydratase family protein [Aeromicrobium sp. Root495]KQY56127.1 epimerase [Aeromicrobium sp. Root495]
MIVITGAGPIGTTIARTYVEQGVAVRVVTRSGSGLDHPLVERIAADVNDRAALVAAAQGATVIHHCVHASAYLADAWARELPAAEAAVLGVAEEVGATVVFPESLYAFDPAPPITERSAIVATEGKRGIRTQLLAARRASSTPTISVVASDYFGPGAGIGAHAGERMLGPITQGKTVRPIGDADQPHSWTYLPDLAAAMIAASELPTEDDRVLMAPTGSPRTQREVANDYATAVGRPAPKVSTVRPGLLRLVGRFHRETAGVAEMVEQFDRPFTMDSSASEALLGLSPTPWDVAVKATVADFLDA